MTYHMITTSADVVIEYNFHHIYQLLEMIHELATMRDDGVLVLYHWHVDTDECGLRNVAS